MSNWGEKASRTGDVFTTDGKNLVGTTKYPTALMQEDHVGVEDYTFPDNPTSNRTLVTIAHGYDYTPAALVFVKDVTTGYFATLRYLVAVDIMQGDIQEFHYYTDDTNFKLLFRITGDPVIDMTDRRYIFKYFVWAQQGM
jgi:hypothetical protein